MPTRHIDCTTSRTSNITLDSIPTGVFFTHRDFSDGTLLFMDEGGIIVLRVDDDDDFGWIVGGRNLDHDDIVRVLDDVAETRYWDDDAECYFGFMVLRPTELIFEHD